MSGYLRSAATRIGTPPQSEPLDSRQVENSAGGYSYPVDKWTRLERFLVLGSEAGSYYASERELTAENATAVLECLAEDGFRTVTTIIDVSKSGRAPSNDPALFALALAASKGDVKTRTAALFALPKVARIGTHLFHFADYVNGLRGWGRGLRRGISEWYLAHGPDELAYQVVKYQQRDGWSHADLLRLAHPKSSDPEINAVMRYAVDGMETLKSRLSLFPQLIIAFEHVKTVKTAKEAAMAIRAFGLTREMVPAEFLNSPEVWEALLEKMPMEAMLRNLGNMSKAGLLTPFSDAEATVVIRLTDSELIRTARLHPLKVLVGMRTYTGGKGLKGGGTWVPVENVVDALDEVFYMAFDTVQPTNKRHMLALDVSGSMSCGNVAGMPLTPREASVAMALVTARTEPRYQINGFSDEFVPINITAKDRLYSAVNKVSGLDFGGTDCSLPILHALKNKLPVDVFVVYTDSETWAGDVHPAQALRQYRDSMGIAAKLIVVGMVSNGFSIADPTDSGMLDVVGFDTAVPAVMAAFIGGDGRLNQRIS